MSVANEITRLQNARNTIRTKTTELGLTPNTAKLDEVAEAIKNIPNRGAISATVQEGDTYTIPAGYHNGTGTVSGVAGGGNYNLQSKTVTPTKVQQAITPDSGYYGLSDVTVAPIPDNFQDVSSTTVTAPDVLANKVFVDAEGAVATGTMPNNGAVNKTLDVTNPSYTVPKGFHNGNGVVNIVTETKTVTPTKENQTIEATVGKVISSVTVNAIPSEFQNVSTVDVTAGDMLAGKVAVGADGKEIIGTMVNNGDVSNSIDGLTVSSVTIPAGFTTGGTISLTDDIETALAAI